MLRELKTKAENWRPSASLDHLRKRALLTARLRAFFAERGLLEVETPLLSQATVPDPYLLSLSTTVGSEQYYLQTSPEYAMKRLLAAGSGSIYQLCKAFRQDERGRFHNPEFTILEWYRLAWDHHQLMQEVDALLQCLLGTRPSEKRSYAEIFKEVLDLDPHAADRQSLAAYAKNLSFQGELDKDGWLQLLMSHCIEPQLGKERPVFIYDFPAEQAALARLHPENPALACRFEVYYQGIELGNGFHELQEEAEQRRRFLQALQEREQGGLAVVPLDERLLAALKEGLPACAGVALGFDRLVMLALKASRLEEVLSFEFSRA